MSIRANFSLCFEILKQGETRANFILMCKHKTGTCVNHRIPWLAPLVSLQGSDRESPWKASGFPDQEDVQEFFAVPLALLDHFKEELDAPCV
jgi:hypothetical protein